MRASHALDLNPASSLEIVQRRPARGLRMANIVRDGVLARTHPSVLRGELLDEAQDLSGKLPAAGRLLKSEDGAA